MLVLGPEAGEPDEARRVRVPITFQDALVGELWVDGSPDRGLLERVASLVAPQVLIGWDTGGDEPWEPVAIPHPQWMRAAAVTTTRPRSGRLRGRRDRGSAHADS